MAESNYVTHFANQVPSITSPQEIVIIDSIPKNKSVMIIRRVLKIRYLGTDAEDTSILEIWNDCYGKA